MHQTTYLATLTDETPEQKLIHFTFKNLSLLQDAINQAVCTLFSIQEIRWNTLKHFAKNAFMVFMFSMVKQELLTFYNYAMIPISDCYPPTMNSAHTSSTTLQIQNS